MHPVVGVPLIPSPVNVAVPPTAARVVVPVSVHVPVDTVSTIESVTEAFTMTTTVGLKFVPDCKVVGCDVNVSVWGGTTLNGLLIASEMDEFVLSCALSVHEFPFTVAVTPVNVAVPPEAVTVVVPLIAHDPELTEMVIESAAAGEMLTATAGLKA